MKVLLRCDASSRIGTGHLVRSLALAQALRDGGDDVVLLTSDSSGPLVDAGRDDGVEVRRLAATSGSAADADATATLAGDTGASWVVLDGYAFDAQYRARVAAPRLAVVDDLGEVALRADLIVNGHFHATPDLYAGATGRLLVGPRYALLRRSFRHARPMESRTGVLLTLGGADPDARTAPLLASLAEAGISGRALVGPQHPAPVEVRETAAAHGWEVSGAVSDIVSLLSSALVAVVGAGTTTLECAALGTPMVAIRIADNQRPVVNALRAAGIAATADANDPVAVAAATTHLLADAAARQRMAEAGRQLVDGRGAPRVAAAMREALLVVRPATSADAARLLEWRNDPETRRASFNSGEVTAAEHATWLMRSMRDSTRMLLVGEVLGQPVGVVRLDVRGSRAAISVTVAPEARGRGLAAGLIRAGAARAAAANVGQVDAFIRPENEASRRAFSAAGFDTVEREPGDGAPASALRMAIILERP